MTFTDPATDVFASEALERLQALTGDPDASFREDQLEAIRDIVVDRARVLCVQRTGWGKSAVYFVATSLLRDEGAGPTLIVSPLLALMRNQIAAAARLGLRARTINSTNRDEWDAVRDSLEVDDTDLLLISPERLANPAFRDRMLPLFARTVGLLVVDEAHCISDWGHDFRPDYRRVREMIEALPSGVAVLGTTATANDRVVADVVDQLGATSPAGARASNEETFGLSAVPDALRTYRGELSRPSLRLEAIDLPAPAQRLAWLAEQLRDGPGLGEQAALPGSGIVYTLTKRDADQVAGFLTAQGIAAEPYSGEQDSDRRIEIEDRLMRGELKAVVATSALGMGYDKPDLGFVVHYQAPGSVIAYYQQVGRAGRGVDEAEIVLLRGREDRAIQDFFIESAFPSRERVDAVLVELADAPDGRTTRELTSVVNLGLGRLEAMLKILSVEGAVSKDGSRWYAVPGTSWSYDGDRYAEVTALRRREQVAMANFGTDGRCLMRALQEELDDPAAADCGRCSVCAGARFDTPPDPALVAAAVRHLRSAPILISPKRQAPDPTGAMKKIPEDVQLEPGLALARFGDGGWWPLVQRAIEGGQEGGPEAAPDAELVAALADLARAAHPDWLTTVPSARPGHLPATLPAHLAAALQIPYVELIDRTGDRPPQRGMANTAQQVANVRGAFRLTGRPPAGHGLLLDDRLHSGWTVAMVGGQLRRAGASAVTPVVLAALG